MALDSNAQNFLAVINAHKGIIYKVANSYCRNDDNRADLIQEIILQLWLSYPKYDPAYRLSTWMYRIALNVSISFYRKEHRRHGINQPLEILSLQPEQAPAEDQGKLDKLYQFIKKLKDIDRAIMLLYLDENDHREIAGMLGLSVTNIATRISRIKQRLKQDFQL